jgi:hypothetical protein
MISTSLCKVCQHLCVYQSVSQSISHSFSQSVCSSYSAQAYCVLCVWVHVYSHISYIFLTSWRHVISIRLTYVFSYCEHIHVWEVPYDHRLQVLFFARYNGVQIYISNQSLTWIEKMQSRQLYHLDDSSPKRLQKPSHEREALIIESMLVIQEPGQ